MFALQEFGDGPVGLEIAGRYERVDVEANTLGLARDFDNLSGAVGATYETDRGLRFGVNLSRVERAPGGEELFANGPHIATQAFEIGDPDLVTESAIGLEGFVRGRLGPATVSLAVFQNWFDDYIYLSRTGGEEADLPVFRYLQQGAEYSGVEGEISLPFYRTDTVTFLADLRGDYIRAELDSGENIPRIPPLSLLGALEAQHERFDARVEVQYFARQDEVAPLENPTDDFTYVNASLALRPFTGQDNVTLLLQSENIFDVEGRRHASFTKDFVPLPGRSLKASVRFSF